MLGLFENLTFMFFCYISELMVKEGYPIASPKALFRQLRRQLLENRIEIVQRQRLRIGPDLIGEIDRAEDKI